MLAQADPAASDDQASRQATQAARAVLGKGELLTSGHLWTLEFSRRARRWLGNFQGFSSTEKRLAAALLDGFLYFSDSHATQLMLAGFHALSSRVVEGASGGVEARGCWTGFFDTALVTYTEGEVQHATDSGGEAARKFRKHAEFPQERIVTPSSALHALMTGRVNKVVFVDDFMGTGNQFVSTWTKIRVFEGQQVYTTSFAEVVPQLSDVTVCYCPSITTTYALERLVEDCPSVIVSAGTVLDARHDVLHPESLVWPAELRNEGQAFVEDLSRRLGLPDTAGAEDDWRGFHKLGLALAVRDSIPDATLRIFRLKQENWMPLVKDA